jgi:hypothetical protein
MSLLKYTVGAFAMVWTLAALTACGPTAETSQSSVGSMKTDDAVSRLQVDQQNASAAIARANVVSTAPAGSGISDECQLEVQNAGEQFITTILTDLQDDLQAIFDDVKNQDTAALGAEYQKYQQVLETHLSDTLDQLQACIPAAPSAITPPSTTPPSNPAGLGLQDFDLNKYLATLSGAH